MLVKVCGVTTIANALACVEAGANFLGLNFHPPSPRFLPYETARGLAATLGGKAELVGLFVDRPIGEVAEVLRQIPEIRTIQLHGHEDPAYLELCRALPARPRVIRAFRLGNVADVASMMDHLARAAARHAAPDAILIDAAAPGVLGGSGSRVAEELLDRLPAHPRMILAGGLDPANVGERVARVRPWMVDVATGVELAPGVKDPEVVRRFVRAARRSNAFAG